MIGQAFALGTFAHDGEAAPYLVIDMLFDVARLISYLTEVDDHRPRLAAQPLCG